MLTNRTARIIALYKQGLIEAPLTVNKGSLYELVRQIGLLQLDSINVVDRSHYLVMLSRLGLYKKSDLDELVYPDHTLFEHWAHAASLIPVKNYQYFAPIIFERRGELLSIRKLKALGNDYESVFRSVLQLIATKGAMMSRDFKDSESRIRTWWNRKPAKIVLDWLFYTGHLMIQQRVNFQCVYDLPERVLHDDIDTINHDIHDCKEWLVLNSIRCLGVGTLHHIADYYRQSIVETRALLQKLESTGEVINVGVEDWNEPAYILSEDQSLIHDIIEGLYDPKRTCFLSPFDNLIWHRERVRMLFNFEYKNEMYVSLKKQRRTFGYYVMPILHNGELIGRLDPKVDRSSKRLVIRKIAFEDETKTSEDMITNIIESLIEFMTFHKCESIIIENTNTATQTSLLSRQLLNGIERGLP